MGMKKWVLIFFIAVLMLGSATSSSAQCSICTKTTQQLGEKPAQGMNSGILYLAFAPFAIVGFIGYRWWKNNKDKRRNYAHIRRARTIDNGGNLTVEEWNAILDFYGHKCLCCGRGDVKLTIDHVIPVFHGGKHSADNVQPLCGPCNSRKKDKHIDYRKEYFHETSRD